MNYSETARAIALTVSHVWTTPAVTAWLTTGDPAFAAAAYHDACDADEAHGETPSGAAARAALAATPTAVGGAFDYSVVQIVKAFAADAVRS